MKRAWSRAWGALFGAVLALGLLPLIGALVEATAPFSHASSRYRGSLDRLTVPDIVMLKADHAVAHERFDLGLFGNSRAVEVSAEHLGLPPGRFFNFAVGGTPFRQSVALLEYLARRGRAPALAVISIDHHALGFDGQIYWPMLMPGRFAFDRAALHDLAATALDQLKGYPAGIGPRLHYLAGGLIDATSDEPLYRVDGSRQARPGRPGAAANGFKRADAGPYYLRMIDADMARLARIAENGTRVVIYESPLHPSVARQHGGDGARLREHFNAACRRERIECHGAPNFGAQDLGAQDIGGAVPWYDCCHAPPAALGRFIASLMR